MLPTLARRLIENLSLSYTSLREVRFSVEDLVTGLEDVAFQGRLAQPTSAVTENIIPWATRRAQWLEAGQLLGIVGLEMDKILAVGLNMVDEMRQKEDD